MFPLQEIQIHKLIVREALIRKHQPNPIASDRGDVTIKRKLRRHVDVDGIVI
jgi:hypothetical protein